MYNLNFKFMKTKLLLIFVLALTLPMGLCAQVDPGTANLKHAWTFDDGTSNDAVGKAHGILTGDAFVEDGHLVINAAGAWVELPGPKIGISAYTELSISTWFTTFEDPTFNSGYQMIWYFGGSEGGLGSNGIFLSPARGDDHCRTGISCGNVATPWTTETAVNFDPEIAYGGQTWHIVTTVDATTVSLYVNGALIGTDALATFNNSLSLLLDDFAWIGRGGYTGDPNYWSKVDEVTMYDKALTADNVLALYQKKATGINKIKNPLNLKIHSSNGNIYIQNADNVTINSIRIYDMLGKLVYNTNVSQNIIHANLPSSVYIVRVLSNKGEYNTKISIR
jgi:hypothetical protein